MKEGGHGGPFVLFLKICIKGDGYYARMEIGRDGGEKFGQMRQLKERHMGNQVGIGKVRHKCMIQLVLLHGLTQANNKKLFLLLDCGK